MNVGKKPHAEILKWYRSLLEPDQYVIVSGLSPRNGVGMDRTHAVVARFTDTGFEMVHDPHPDNTFIVGEPTRIVAIHTKLTPVQALYGPKIPSQKSDT